MKKSNDIKTDKATVGPKQRSKHGRYVPPHKKDHQIDDYTEYQKTMRGREKYWARKGRPTHFLCLRVTDSEILGRVAATHSKISALNSEYADCLTPPELLHITLAVLGLDTEEKVQHAVETLEFSYEDRALLRRNFY